MRSGPVETTDGCYGMTQSATKRRATREPGSWIKPHSEAQSALLDVEAGRRDEANSLASRGAAPRVGAAEAKDQSCHRANPSIPQCGIEGGISSAVGGA